MTVYKNILVSTDGSEVAQKGVDHGLSLAKALGAKVTIVTVTERFPINPGVAGLGWVPGPDDLTEYEAGQKSWADEVLATTKAAAERLGVSAVTVHVPDERPAEAILAIAKSHDCSLIAMSSHGRRGLQSLLLGSQTAEVLAHSPIPVLVVR